MPCRGRVLVGGESANALDNREGDLRDFRLIAIAMGVLILGVLILLLRAFLAPLILLATRMREEIATHGFTEGIRVALTRTGGVITSAGLILAGTFAALMTQPLNSLVQFGFAMAVGILLDTFLIRGVLVPGLFRLLGPRIWWPGRLSGSDPAGTRVSPRALERTG